MDFTNYLEPASVVKGNGIDEYGKGGTYVRT